MANIVNLQSFINYIVTKTLTSESIVRNWLGISLNSPDLTKALNINTAAQIIDRVNLVMFGKITNHKNTYTKTNAVDIEMAKTIYNSCIAGSISRDNFITIAGGTSSDLGVGSYMVISHGSTATISARGGGGGGSGGAGGAKWGNTKGSRATGGAGAKGADTKGNVVTVATGSTQSFTGAGGNGAVGNQSASVGILIGYQANVVNGNAGNGGSIHSLSQSFLDADIRKGRRINVEAIGVGGGGGGGVITISGISSSPPNMTGNYSNGDVGVHRTAGGTGIGQNVNGGAGNRSNTNGGSSQKNGANASATIGSAKSSADGGIAGEKGSGGGAGNAHMNTSNLTGASISAAGGGGGGNGYFRVAPSIGMMHLYKIS